VSRLFRSPITVGLYYYEKDKVSGDVTGQDVGGVWYVVSAKGEQVSTP
jgi:predicted lipoprotein with Yx(FWY)xxD motif